MVAGGTEAEIGGNLEAPNTSGGLYGSPLKKMKVGGVSWMHVVRFMSPG